MSQSIRHFKRLAREVSGTFSGVAVPGDQLENDETVVSVVDGQMWRAVLNQVSRIGRGLKREPKNFSAQPTGILAQLKRSH